MSKFIHRNWPFIGFAGLVASIIIAFMIVVQPCISCNDGVPIGVVLYDSYVRPFTKCL